MLALETRQQAHVEQLDDSALDVLLIVLADLFAGLDPRPFTLDLVEQQERTAALSMNSRGEPLGRAEEPPE